MTPKQRAGEAALKFVQNDSIIGLGTGSTAECFIHAVGQALKDGRLRNVRGVPTSIRSEQLARQLGIPTLTLAEVPGLEMTVDGTDEFDPQLNLIKGLGGALVREKIVAQNTHRLIIIADESKRVAVLGTKCPLPVEVLTFAHEAQERYLKDRGCTPSLRHRPDGMPFITDNGNYIYDCRFESIPHPAELENQLRHRAGIVDCGLFLNMASVLLVASDHTVQELHRR